MKYHVIVLSHDGKELDCVLTSLAYQTNPPDSLVVTCDGLVPEIERQCAEHHAKTGQAVVYVGRASKAVGRRAQSRNNGVRALSSAPTSGDWLVFVDGDVVIQPSHLAVLRSRVFSDIVLSYVWRLDPTRSELLRERIRQGRRTFKPSTKERLGLALYAMKLQLQCCALWLDRKCSTRFSRPWWPSLGSGNFAVRYDLFEKVNGFDEGFEGWGGEDTDLGVRLYSLRPRVARSVTSAAGFHLWHPPSPHRNSALCPATFEVGKRYSEFGLNRPADQTKEDLEIRSWPAVQQVPQALVGKALCCG